MQVLVQIDAWDPVAAALVTLRAASHDDPRVCHAAGETWWPALAKLPVLRYDLFDGAFGQEITGPSSSLTIQTEPFSNFGRHSFADGRFRLWTGDVDIAPGSWTLRFDGRVVAQPEVEDGAAAIEFAVDDRWLDGALLATYAGTTGAEGPAAMKGQAKPWALGAPRYVAGKLIDSVNIVFQVSDGPVQEFEAALERLVRFGAPIADYPTYAALVAATVPAGRWATAKAVGMARFGAPTEGQVSFLIKGDNAGPDGWARKPGELIRQIALRAGGSGKIDDASLDALDVARPCNLSLYIDDQTSARQLIQQIAASVNAVAGVSWLGQLFVAPIGLGSPSVTLAADGSALPPVASVRQVEIAPPWKKLGIGAERAWTVHALGDIAFTAPLLDMGAYQAGTTYREGNIVQDQASSWLYINPTPASGHAPPALPTTSNAYWKVLAAQGADGAPGPTGAAGSSAYTLSVISNASVPAPGQVAFLGGGSNIWNKKACTLEGFRGASVSAHLTSGTGVGLTVDPAVDSDFDSVDYWFHRSPDGNLYLFREGSLIRTMADPDAAAPAAPSGPFAVVSDTKTVRYFHKGTELPTWAHGPNSADEVLFGVFNGANPGTSASQIGFAAAGPSGESARNMSLSPDSVIVTADHLGAVTAGQLPKYVTVTATDGLSVTSPSLSIAVSDPANITASVSGGTVSISAVGVDIGSVEVSASGYPTKRISVTRSRAGLPGSDATSVNSDLGISVVTGSGAESFAGSPNTSTLLLKASPGGQLILTAAGEYYADQPPSGVRRITVKAMAYYRVAGSGTGWSTFSGPHTGSQAEEQANVGGFPGTIAIGGTKTGLTADVLYEVGCELRRDTTTGSTAANGNLPATLSQS